MTENLTFQNNYPFITCVRSNEIEYVGIIVNFDVHVISLYDIAIIQITEQRNLFLELGETWWWESNRKIPINIFLKKEMQSYRHTIKTLTSKDAVIVFGPIVNLSELAEKRVKRKSIQLVRTSQVNRG